MRRLLCASWLCLAVAAFQPPGALIRDDQVRDQVKMHTSFSPLHLASRQEVCQHSDKAPFRRENFSGSKLEWLEQATGRAVDESQSNAESSPRLTDGKWHEVVSLLNAWSSQQKSLPQAALRIESLLHILVEERRMGNSAIDLTMALYNSLLDAWACAALFRLIPNPISASQRAREILVTLQENYDSGSGLQPNAQSFDIVLHVVCKIEGALAARRVLAWMEYLSKSEKNPEAQPDHSDYVQILTAYTREPSSGLLATGFVRHMRKMNVTVDTLCWNIVMKAWNRQRRGRQTAEHVDQILAEMKELPESPPDLISYSTTISAWAASGMKSHAVSRVEELLREIEESEHMEANTIVLNAVMSAWVKAKSPAAVNRTEEILRQMEVCFHAQPDLISYNTHLHALSIHSNPKRPHLAQKAETMLRGLVEGYDSGRLSFAPNVFSYNLVIEAICRTQDANSATRAAHVLRSLIQRKEVEPDTFSFNQVLSVLSRTVGSAGSALELLRYMDESHKTGLHTTARPDAASFAFVISGFTWSGEKGAAERAEQLLDEMKERSANGEEQLKPSRACYNALIDCWAKSGEGTLGARKAEALLREMKELFDAGEKSVEPNLVTFNSVLNAWARSGTRCCGYKAEQCLEQMWQLYNAGYSNVKPNDFSYNTVINAISKSKHEEKAQKALRMLRRMDKLYQAGYKGARPNEITYTAVINSCAFPSAKDLRTRRKALDTALFTLKELQSSRYGQPNQVTYGTFIKACANLLHDDEEMRRQTISAAFEQCCRDGQLGRMVLNYTPRDLADELLAGYVQSGQTISLPDLPPEWRCNVRDKDEWKGRRQPFKQHSVARRATTTKSREPKLRP